MAVIVQQQIEPEAAGVAFSVDPVTGSRSRIVIESCRGLGEALVSGQVQPDRILLRKKNLELIRQNLVADEPSLDLKSAQRLARSAFGASRNAWAARRISNGRSATARSGFSRPGPSRLSREPKPWEDRQVWTNPNLGEVFPEVVTPMTYSVVVAHVPAAVRLGPSAVRRRPAPQSADRSGGRPDLLQHQHRPRGRAAVHFSRQGRRHEQPVRRRAEPALRTGRIRHLRGGPAGPGVHLAQVHRSPGPESFAT